MGILPKHSVLRCVSCLYTSESCFYTFDWVGWRLARGEDGWGRPTRVPQEVSHFSCKMSVIAHHLMTSQF